VFDVAIGMELVPGLVAVSQGIMAEAARTATAEVEEMLRACYYWVSPHVGGWVGVLRVLLFITRTRMLQEANAALQLPAHIDMAYSFNRGFPASVMLAIYQRLNATSWRVFLSCFNHQEAAQAGLNCAPCSLCTLNAKNDDNDKDPDKKHSSCFFTLREEGDKDDTGYRVYIIWHQAPPALASPPAVQGPGGTVRLTSLGSSQNFAFVGRATPPRAQTEGGGGHDLASRRKRTERKDREREEFNASRRPTKKRKADSDDEEDEEESEEEEEEEEEEEDLEEDEDM
jgi:hypothetical protein